MCRRSSGTRRTNRPTVARDHPHDGYVLGDHAAITSDAIQKRGPAIAKAPRSTPERVRAILRVSLNQANEYLAIAQCNFAPCSTNPARSVPADGSAIVWPFPFRASTEVDMPARSEFVPVFQSLREILARVRAQAQRGAGQAGQLLPGHPHHRSRTRSRSPSAASAWARAMSATT